MKRVQGGSGHVAGLLAFCFFNLGPSVRADTFYWTNLAGGVYSAPTNWSPNGVPSGTDSAVFTNAGAYTLTVDQITTNSEAFFHQGSVTQAIPSATWFVTNAFRLGELSGSNPRVTAVSGVLAITNASGSAVLAVGGSGTGELAIRGGNVITDFLQASNGERSILTFGHGSLTTLQGSVVSNATKLLTLGTTSGSLFTWNVAGGTNAIRNTGRDPYGGLTLGTSSGGGRARVNLTGTNTALSVLGLDTYGRNELNVSSGARFQTGSVQLGLDSGVSNVVVIADPGSAWINDYLMYFGMHAGAQTMVISNGGYFKTGGTPFGDGTFTSFDQLDSTILVTGTNSWFHSDGRASFGISWSTPVTPLNNLLLVTNGGRFWARQLTYGITNFNLGVSRPGNLVRIADGDFWIGSLSFVVGTLRVETGSGTIDELLMTGGTNAVLQTLGNMYVGHQGNLGAGELRIGGANSTIASLSGEVRLGGWQLGAFAGTSGAVTMNGGRAGVSNTTQTAALVVGGAGTGFLRVNAGFIQADVTGVGTLPGGAGQLILDGSAASMTTPTLIVGNGGTVVVSNAARLQINGCSAPASAVRVNQATLEFTSGTPSLSASAITTTNAILSFRNATAAELDAGNPNYLGRVQRSGQTFLQLVHTTNAPLASLTLRDNDVSTWSGLFLNGGTSEVNSGSILVETNSSLAATNTLATINGNFTNHGQLKVYNSTLRFVGPVTWSDTASMQGSQGFLRFTGGLHLPATDVLVPPGISVQASTITSDGGKLVINGGGIIPNDDGTVPGGMVLFQDGWVTYLDSAAVPLTRPAGLTGQLGLELIRSTNAPALSPVIISGVDGYERLRLGNGSRWQSHELVIGQGGSLFIADPAASVTLTSGVFRVEHGGYFRDDTGGTNYVGFNPACTNASITVSGTGSTWLAPGVLAIGSGGSQNQMRIESGGMLRANLAVIGGSSANFNRLILNGAGSSFYATNGLTLTGNQNQLLVQTGAVFTGSQILAGNTALISIVGTGAVANCSNQVVLSGSSARLQMDGGGSLFTSNAFLNASSGSQAELYGSGTLWKLTGGLAINPTSFSFSTNRVVIGSKATVIAPSVTLGSSTFGRNALVIQSGQLYVTNSLGSGQLTANGPIDLNGGLLRADILTAGSSSSSAINLRAGRAEWKASDFVTGVALRIGDGVGLASLNLLGGTNILRSGLEVRRYSQLAGSGGVIGSVTNRGRLIPSAINVRGSLTLDTTSELGFNIAGPPGSPLNSSLVVTGAVTLAGRLGISVATDNVPSSTSTFVLLQAAGIASNFSNVTFGQRLLTADRLASFRIDKTATTMVATDFQSEDLDGDGIQDTWAIQYFGISPLLPGTGPSDLNGDWDGDGLGNHSEFVFGTDPNNASSGLFIQVDAAAFGFINLHYPYFPNRLHWISASSDLSNWTETLIEEFWFDSQGRAVWTDRIAPGGGKRFFRLLYQ